MKLFFIGAGNMGGAILSGLSGNAEKDSVVFFEPDSSKAQTISKQTGFASVPSIETAAQADWIVLCVKPQVFPAVAEQLQPLLKATGQNSPKVLSIMAGVSLASLKDKLGSDLIVVRSMPNLPMSVGAGTVALATDNVPAEALSEAETFFSSVAQCVRVSESQMDIITGLSGSGPAFVFEFSEAMIQAGVKGGLSRDVATSVAFSVLSGSAELLKQSSHSPADLSNMVSSPGGTTIFGLHKLAEKGFRSAVMDAVLEAARRSEELRTNN